MTTYTKVANPSGTSYTKVSNPTPYNLVKGNPIGLLLSLTYAYATGNVYTKVGNASGTVYTKVPNAT